MKKVNERIWVQHHHNAEIHSTKLVHERDQIRRAIRQPIWLQVSARVLLKIRDQINGES